MNQQTATRLCPQCGARLPEDDSCQTRFELCLVKDYEHPDTFGQVHHLIVACMMLQHNAYSRQGWLAARQLVAQSIQQGTPPSVLRQQNAPEMDSGQRRWNLTRGEKISAVEHVTWTCTIADVRTDSAEHYCEDAQRWAIHVLADTAALMQELETERK